MWWFIKRLFLLLILLTLTVINGVAFLEFLHIYRFSYRKWLWTLERSRPASLVGRILQVLRPPALPAGIGDLGVVQLGGLLETDRELSRNFFD